MNENGKEALNHLFDVICSECKHNFYKNGNECSKQCNIPETITIIKKDLEILEIIKKKWVSPKNFRLTNYVMNGYKWIAYESYKKAYMNYYEDDEYLLTETEFNLIKEWLER